MKFDLGTTSSKSASGNNGTPCIKCSQGIIDQIKSVGLRAAGQFTIKNVAPDTYRGNVTFTFQGKQYTFRKGDTHAIWFCHQGAEAKKSFEDVLDVLSDNPGVEFEVELPVKKEDIKEAANAVGEIAAATAKVTA